MVACFEACIPRDFWGVVVDDVKWNKGAFDGVVRPYCNNIAKARLRGYGLLFLGDNGVGKTMFLSYVLTRSISSGFTAYYTTLPRLDFDIKRGFNDRSATERLRLMLTSDFVAIDEMGKEKFKAGDSYIRTQVERILKERFDDSLPTIIATNASIQGLEKIYGATLTSILSGKFEMVTMEPGDFRPELRKRMGKEMGFVR
jgi:DNA replication protein DnaC